jgi:predicted esterase
MMRAGAGDAADPHASQPVSTAGPPPPEARLAVILVHGRGASPGDILDLARQLGVDDVAYLAPHAAGSSWYPHSFLEPIAMNEPGLSSAFGVLSRLVESLRGQGLEAHRVGFLGFSQGACLALEYAARHARRYAGVFGLSGGLVGPPGTPRDYQESLDGTPVFLGCSDVDPHIPLARVHESADVFGGLGARVDERIYKGMGHTVNDDELAAVAAVLKGAERSRASGAGR